jgi:hypothetical protein
MGSNLKTDRISGAPDRSKSATLLQRVAEIWMAAALFIFFLLRILGSELFRQAYLRWKAF